MSKVCTTERAVQTQFHIENNLLDLMRKKPYEKITVMELCEKAEVTRKVFYRHFSNKHDVLLSMIDRFVMDCVELNLLSGQFAEAGIYLFRQCKLHSDLTDAVFKNALHSLLLQRVMIHFRREDNSLSFALKQMGHNDDNETMVFFLGGLVNLIHYWHYSGYEKTEEEMAQLFKKMMSKPFIGNI